MKKAGMVLVAHGSRHLVSNDEIRRLVAELRERLTVSEYVHVGVGFLELATPSIPQSLAEAAGVLREHNVTELLVFPYFLARGSHVGEDIPRIVTEEGEKYPALNVRLLPYLGAGGALREVILGQVRDFQKNL